MITCEDLKLLCEPHGIESAVLSLIKDKNLQLVTYGKDGFGILLAHTMKEEIKKFVFFDKPPEPVVHESFITEAAQNVERIRKLEAEVQRLQAAIEAKGN